MHHPRREQEVAGPLSVRRLLNGLSVNRETVLVIVDGTLVTGDQTLPDEAVVELRPVISGGA